MSQQDRLNAEPPRSRIPMIVGVVVAVIALIAATVMVTGALGDERTAPPTSTTPPPTPETSTSSTATDSNAAGAKGCLGGVNPTKAVLTAQKESSLNAKGAAAFAATVMRWHGQYPVDPDYADKAKKIMTPDAGADLLTVDPPEGGPEDSGWGTTADARYRVTESTKTTATVEILMPFFGTSKEYPEGVEVESAARWRLVAEDGEWRVTDMDPIEEDSSDRKALKTRGLTFQGVC